MEVKCKHCGRHLNLKQVQSFVGEIICTNSKCKGGTFINFTSNDPYKVYKQISKTQEPKETADGKL